MKGSINCPTAIIWDWNGTLLNDVDIACKAMNHLLTQHDLPYLTKHQYLEIFQFPVEIYYQKLGFDFAKTPFNQLAKEFIEIYYKLLPSSQLHEGIEELLGKIKDLGIKQYILSAMEQKALETSVQHQNITTFFDGIYGIPDIFGASKMNRGYSLIETEQLVLKTTLFIGDTHHDFELAQKLQCAHLLVSQGHQSLNRLRKITPLVAEDYSQILPKIFHIFT